MYYLHKSLFGQHNLFNKTELKIIVKSMDIYRMYYVIYKSIL